MLQILSLEEFSKISGANVIENYTVDAEPGATIEDVVAQ